jgi:AP-1 complex subunit sigma 1/2
MEITRQSVRACMQAYYILDEILIAGELQESSKRSVIRLVCTHVHMSSLLRSLTP